VTTVDPVSDAILEAAAGPAAAFPRRAWTLGTERALGRIVEPVVAAIIVAEIAILAGGVLARYVLHDALSWGDELAAILFLWMTMLGAVVAYRRSEHMRLTVLLRRVSPGTRAWLDVVCDVAILWFCALMIPASRTLMLSEWSDLTPALSLPRTYIIAAIATGLGLIAIIAILRLADRDLRRVAVVALVAIALSFAGFALRDPIGSLGNIDLVLFFVLVVGVALAIGIPISFSFGIGAVSYLLFATRIPLSIAVGRMNEGVSNIILLAVPLFVLLGLLLEATGVARRLVAALASLVGHFRGGLNVVLIAAMYLVSGISGSKSADMAAVAPVLFPEMERRGYKRSEMIALLATSGAMAETIPPSLVLIIVGTIATVSIRDLFTAGLLPAAIASIALLIVSFVRSRGDTTERVARASGKTIARAFLVALPGLALPLLIRWFVVGGIATATEVSTVGIVYTLVVGAIVYREFDWRRAYPMLVETAALTGAVGLIIATATAMAWSITRSGLAQQLANVLAHAGGAAGFMALSIVLFAVLGSVLEGIPALVLFGPLLFPIAAQFNINEVHYAIVVVLAMGIGLFAPPLGIGYYAACAIAKCSPDTATKPILPYLAALFAALVLIAAVPWISLGFLRH
jgi:tripartite ATP-independent transporter DctM subunit